MTRRGAYASESALTATEQKKKSQDALIDRLNEQYTSLTEQQVVLQKQVTAQKAETEKAKSALEGVMNEMQSVVGERKEYLNKWKSRSVLCDVMM